MPGECGRLPGAARLVVATILAAGLLLPRPLQGRSLRGVAEVEYANLDRAGASQDLESWQTAFQLDFSTPLRRSTTLSSQFRWNELTYTDRPNRTKTPQASLRLTHAFYGLAVSYRPVTVTDASNVTSKQQELRFTGHFAKPGLPRLTGSWARRHIDPTRDYAAGVSVRRDLSGSYTHGAFDLRAGWGDQSRKSERDGDRGGGDDRISFGATGRFRRSRWDGYGQYDFNQMRTKVGGDVARISRLHSVNTASTLRIARRTTGALGYSLQHTRTIRPVAVSLTEHNGSASVTHDLSRVFRASAAGGVRSAAVRGGRDTESFVMASVAASAPVRPGWTVSSGLTHSYNWLPRERPRPITSFRASTLMRLAPRLELNGSLNASHAKRPIADTDTSLATRQATVQAGAGIRATPRAPITVLASASRSRTADTFGLDGQASTSYTARVDWKPHTTLLVNGAWSRTSGFRRGEMHRTHSQVTTEWNPVWYLQAAGTYTRFTQPTRDPSTSLTGSRESFGGRVVVGLTRDLRATIQYSEADPNLPTQSQQLTVTVTQSFRR